MADGEQFETSMKKGRGMAQRSLELIDAMYEIAEECQPITGRGIGYKLFARGLIASMAIGEMQKVYRLLKEARERDIIPWEWIVDETRELEKVSTWKDPKAYVREVRRSYRRDFWNDQPQRVEVWSEKGTIRGVLQPVLDEYGVGFRVMHGFGSATAIHAAADDYDGRDLVVLYVGDYDPSGLCMSEVDLPNRLERYDGDHVELERIALTRDQLAGLQSFPAADKAKDKRYAWFVKHYGKRCWELDAMDPNTLREIVEAKIDENVLDEKAWERCRKCQEAEQQSLQTVLDAWGSGQQ
jgi:hypothetical protein